MCLSVVNYKVIRLSEIILKSVAYNNGRNLSRKSEFNIL
jgi:hypothetical protein